MDKLNRIDVTISNTENNKERSILSSYSSCVFPELRVCEQRLSCIIEGTEKDRLLVRFSRIDVNDIDREVSFVIDLSNQVKGRSLFCLICSLIQVYSDDIVASATNHGYFG